MSHRRRQSLQLVLGTAATLTLLHTLSFFYLFDIDPGLWHGRAIYLFVVLWLLSRRRFGLGALLLAIPYLPRILQALKGLERAELAIYLIAGAFVLLATGLGLHLRFGARSGS